MSDWFITPAIENAVIVLATIPDDGGEAETDDEQDYFPDPNWQEADALLSELLASGKCTPYLFFDPPAAEDSLDRLLREGGNHLSGLGVAAQPYGSLSARINGSLRRIFARNETRRAVVVLAGRRSAGEKAIHDATEVLATRASVVIGVDADGGLTLFGCRTYQPELLEGINLLGGTGGVETLLARLRERMLTHEILPSQ
jgi:hypothetical protein